MKIKPGKGLWASVPGHILFAAISRFLFGFPLYRLFLSSPLLCRSWFEHVLSECYLSSPSVCLHRAGHRRWGDFYKVHHIKDNTKVHKKEEKMKIRKESHSSHHKSFCFLDFQANWPANYQYQSAPVSSSLLISPPQPALWKYLAQQTEGSEAQKNSHQQSLTLLISKSCVHGMVAILSIQCRIKIGYCGLAVQAWRSRLNLQNSYSYIVRGGDSQVYLQISGWMDSWSSQKGKHKARDPASKTKWTEKMY